MNKQNVKMVALIGAGVIAGAVSVRIVTNVARKFIEKCKNKKADK